MEISPIDAMQSAVDVVANSPHLTNKIAATVFKGTRRFSSTNHWPQIILDKIGTETRIGSSSGTVHAEVECLLKFPGSLDGASLCITDPFCPNCAKNIAESGIKKIYIDYKGFDKDFAKRRNQEFENMSLRIVQRAGISLYELNRKENRVTPISESPENYKPPQDNPIKIEATSLHPNLYALNEIVSSAKVLHKRWGCALATNARGETFSLIASAHPAIGYTRDADGEIISHKEGKYSFYLEPMNRLLMGAHRHGLKLVDGLVWSSMIPTSRELVNCVAAGIETLCLGTREEGRDEDAIIASRLLADKGVMQFISL